MKKIHYILTTALITLSRLTQAGGIPGPVVSADWLANHLDEVQVLEVRTDVASYFKTPQFEIDEKTGNKFLVDVGGHINNSSPLDFKRVRAERLINGRKVKFLLPEKADFEKLIQSAGINSDKPIVLVPVGQDISDIDEALRTYWEFKVYGQNQIAVLDGGIAGWLGNGHEFTTENPKKNPGNWTANGFHKELIASSPEVSAASENGKAQLLDARQPAQYWGVAKSPAVMTYGHIAGAKELAPELLTKSVNGALYFWPKNTYEALILGNGMKNSGMTITYCNTGHLAAGAWFVVSEIIGNKNAKLYDGSLHLWTIEGRPLVGVPLN